MYFKLEVIIPYLFVLGNTVKFEKIGDNQNFSVILKTYEVTPGQTNCEAISEVKPSKNALPTFEALWLKPPSTEFDSTNIHTKQPELPLSQLPDSVQNIVYRAYKELIEIINKVVGTTCWRYAQKAPIYSYQASRIMWSMDGKDWRMAPANFVMSDVKPNILHQDFVIDTVNLINNEQTEPLCHELLREAWTQKDTNPRSSLVIGVTALETGVKDLISYLVPEADWFIRSPSSPPIFKILKEYLPSLPDKLKANNTVIRLSKKMLQDVETWNRKRNSLVHGKPEEIKAVELKEFLLLVYDLLYLCDFYRGFDWAYEHIRADTKVALTAE